MLKRFFLLIQLGVCGLPLILAATTQRGSGATPYFEKNVGQFPAEVQFVLHQSGYAIRAESGGIALTDCTGKEAPAVRMLFPGGRPGAAWEGEGLRSSVSHYFFGADPTRWKKGVPHYDGVRMRKVWDGVDVVFRSSDAPEFDFVVGPDVETSQIRMRFRGSKSFTIHEGALVLKAGTGEIRVHAPNSFTVTERGLVAIGSRYVLLGPEEVGVEVERSGREPLLIDPVLSFSTYIGGGKGENGTGLAKVRTDAAGNIYTAGTTSSDTMAGWPMMRPFGGGTSADAFLIKTDATGQLIFATYFGGSGTEEMNGMAVDDLGQVVIGGATSSDDFPVVRSLHGRKQAFDGFVARFTQNGELDYSTYFGGSDADRVLAVAVNSQRKIVLAGATGSSDLPIKNALMSSKPSTSRCRFVLLGTFETTVSCRNVFVAKLDADSGELLFSTYLGGARMNTQLLEGDIPYAIALDVVDNIYVVGQTAAGDFPVTDTAMSRTSSGSMDGFITKLTPDGLGPVRSTYFGGSGVDWVQAVAVDGDGNAYVCGVSTSTDLPNGNASQPVKNGDADAFIAKLNEEMSKVFYSTYYGGDKFDICFGLALHPSGLVVAAGGTSSTNLVTLNPVQRTAGGGDDSFIVTFDPSGQMTRSSYFGGSKTDTIIDVAFDANGGLYLTGQTNSEDFPVLAPLQDKLAGSYDAFLGVYRDFLSATSFSPEPLKRAVSEHSSLPDETGILPPLRAYRTTDGGILLVATGDENLVHRHSRVLRQMEPSEVPALWLGNRKASVREIRNEGGRAEILLEAERGVLPEAALSIRDSRGNVLRWLPIDGEPR